MAEQTYFVTDTVQDYWISPVEGSFFIKIGIGASVLKVGGVWRTVTNPDTELTAAATRYYAGGRRYPVTASEIVELIEGGFLEQLVPPPEGIVTNTVLEVV